MFNIKNTKTALAAKKKYEKKSYTPEQIKGLLKGYVLVPVEKYDSIPINSHVRYFKTDGTFVRGGFVTSHWLDKNGKSFIHLANSFKKGKNYATWPVAHENCSKVYKKVDNKNGIEMDIVRNKTSEIINQINRLVDVVKRQKKVIDKQGEDIKALNDAVNELSLR